MTTRTFLAALPVLGALLACGLAGTGLTMKYTSVDSTPKHYDELAAAAKALGWDAKRGKSSTDWELEVYPKAGERMRYTGHVQDNVIGFNCDGGSLDDTDACIAAANKVFKKAWNLTVD